MSGIAWASLAAFIVAVVCFTRGAFSVSWDGAAWMFYAAVSLAVALTLFLVGVFT